MKNLPVKNYIPSSISFAEGFWGPKGSVGYLMIYEHSKAFSIVKRLIIEKRKVTHAVVGLDGDFDCNSAHIFANDQFLEPHFHKESCWATPILMVFFEDGPSEMYEVWSKK